MQIFIGATLGTDDMYVDVDTVKSDLTFRWVLLKGMIKFNELVGL